MNIITILTILLTITIIFLLITINNKKSSKSSITKKNIDNTQQNSTNKIYNENKEIKPEIKFDEINQKSHQEEQESTAKSNKNFKENINENDSKKIDDIIEELRKTNIRPLSNQQRNLDREEGGLENEIQKSETHIIDEWDSRGEDIIAMGKSNPINNSSAKKSMLWNLKRKRLQEKKIAEEIGNIEDDIKKLRMRDKNEQDGGDFDSRKKQSLTQKINALKEDRTDFKDPKSHGR
jgi:hypothetical protein